MFSDREVRTGLAVLLGIFSAWCGHAVGGESAVDNGAIARAVQRELDAGLFPGAVVLVGRPGKVLYHDAFGHARIVPDKVKMAKDCIFDLASVTKPVATATAFGVCVDRETLAFRHAHSPSLARAFGQRNRADQRYPTGHAHIGLRQHEVSRSVEATPCLS